MRLLYNSQKKNNNNFFKLMTINKHFSFLMCVYIDIKIHKI